MSMEERIKDLRAESGTVTYIDPLTSFFYELMRDHLPTGVVEKLVWSVLQEPDDGCVFTNGWLAKYANNLSLSIQKKSSKGLGKVLSELEDEQSEKDEVLEGLNEQLDSVPHNTIDNIKESIKDLQHNGVIDDEEASRLSSELEDLELDDKSTDDSNKSKCDGTCGENCCQKTGGPCCHEEGE
jgi:hypothetical protein